MSPTDKPWRTSYPAEQDTAGVEQPDLANDSVPGAHDGDRILVEHLHSLRDKAQALAEKVGDDNNLPADSLLGTIDVLLNASWPNNYLARAVARTGIPAEQLS